MKTYYIVRLSHFYNPDSDEYRFTSEEKRDRFLSNLPPFYKENPSFVSQDVMIVKEEVKK